jgi:hypothetical protein
MAAKVFVGARAKVYVDDVLVGLYESCSYGANIGQEAIHLLGRYGAAEITPTSYEAVSVQCSGFRVIGQGVHLLPKFPKLEDLLNLEAVTLAIVDRQGGETIMTVTGCIPVSYSTGVNAKATSRINVSYVGLKLTDENGDQNEAGATELP